MSQGYSLKIARLTEAADAGSLGVRLGRECVRRDVPVVEVARHFGVSRQTIYNWFTGSKVPRREVWDRIEAFLARAPDQ